MVRLAVIGEMIADVAHIGGTQQSITNGMNQDVSITMSEQSE